VATKDSELSQLVDASNAVFQAFTNQDRALRSTLQQLPGTLQVAQTNLAKTDRLAKALGPTLQALRPGARALGPSLSEMRPFLTESTPIIRDKIRPFARESLPTVKILRPAAQNLSKLTPDVTSALKVVNYLLNELAFDPPGDAEEGYLFWTAWTNHAGASVFATQDAHGPIRKGMVLASCSTLQTLPSIARANPQLGLLIQLLNPVSPKQACPQAAGAGAAPPSPTGAGGQGTPALKKGGG
jgi:phospholipid/cholesterol/gamma-HCH transport system substrate-binding protein